MRLLSRFFSVVLIFVLISTASAEVRRAITCNISEVRNRISEAQEGDTVEIGGGTCDWGDTLEFSKGITIRGAGAGVPSTVASQPKGVAQANLSNTAGNTIITNGGFIARVPAPKSWRISGIRFRGRSGITVYSNSKMFRIDHNFFEDDRGRTEDRVIWVQPDNGEYIKGVIDQNLFYFRTASVSVIQIHYRGGNDEGGGGGNFFARPLGMGTDDALFIENNDFHHVEKNISACITDCEGGGRLVYRHNSSYNSYFLMHDAIIVGLRSCRLWEVYDNSFSGPPNASNPNVISSGLCTYMGIRGGTGVVFNNKLGPRPDCGAGITFGLYRADPTLVQGGEVWSRLCSSSSGKACLNAPANGPGSPIHLCTSDAQCGGRAGTCVNIDGPSTDPNGLYCRDQIGADQLPNGSMTKSPALLWNNQVTSGRNPVDGGTLYDRIFTAADMDFNSANADRYIRNNLEYCVGNGADPALKPTTCNQVAVTYSPYEYPHPFRRLLADGASNNPVPPSRLRAVP